MEKEDIRQIFTYLKVQYPHSYDHLSNDEEARMLLAIWHDILKDEDKKLVQAAVKKYVSENTTGFAPTIGQIRHIMVELTGIRPMSVDEAWSIARGYWSSIGTDNPYELQSSWEKLPESIKAIYSPHDMVELGFRTSSHEVEAYEKPRFMKRWAEMEKTERQKCLDCKSISKLAIETTGRLMIEHVS